MAKVNKTIAPSIVPAIAPIVKAASFDFKAYPIVKGAANIEKLIKTTSKKYATLKPLLHQALLSATLHATDTNDTTLVTKFWNACSNEINKRNGIATWLGRYTNLQYRKAKDGSMQWLKPKKDSMVTFEDEAKAIPFYDMPKVDSTNNAAPFSLFQALERLLTRAENMRTNGKLSDYDAKELAAINKAHLEFVKKNPLPVVSAVAGEPETVAAAA